MKQDWKFLSIARDNIDKLENWTKLKIGQKLKLDKLKIKQNWKLDKLKIGRLKIGQIENWPKLIGQNWKLDKLKIENWTKMKIRQIEKWTN